MNSGFQWLMRAVLLVLSGATNLAEPSNATADEILRKYLERLGLSRLALRSVELEFDRQLDPVRRQELAQSLAATYIHRLQSTAVQSPPDARLLQRARRLSDELPPPLARRLHLAMAHGQYTLAESQYLTWTRTPRSQSMRAAVYDSFQSVRENLLRQLDFWLAIRKSALSDLPFSAEASEARQQLDQAEAQILQAHYLLGWTNYYLAVTATKLSTEDLERAHQSFYQVLQIDQPQTMDRIDAKWLDLVSPISGRCMLGLAMVYSAWGNDTASQICFERAARQQYFIGSLSLWRLNSLLYARRWQDAANFLHELTTAERIIELSQAQTLYVAAIQAARWGADNHPRSTDQPAIERLERTGWIGLLRQFDYATIRYLVSLYEVVPSDEESVGLWIQAALALDQSSSNLIPLPEVHRKLQQVLVLAKESGQANSEIELVDILTVHYLIAWAYFRGGEYNAAIDGLPKIDPWPAVGCAALAERMSWLRCRCSIEIARTAPQTIPTAMAVLQDFATRYPQSPFVNRADFERTRLSYLLLPAEEALEELEQVDSSHPAFVEYQYERVATQFRHWKNLQALGESPREAAAFQQLVELDHRFRQLPTASIPLQLTSLLHVLDAALSRPTDPSWIETRIQDAERTLEQYSGDRHRWSIPIADYRFRAHIKFGRIAAATREAQWLLDNSRDTQLEIRALIFLAKQLDHPDTPLAQLIGLYEDLSERMALTSTMTMESGNARAVATRLAELYLANRQFDQAESWNQKLLEQFPDDWQYSLQAARIAIGQEKLANALPFWRRLAAESRPGSDIWLEAKYGIIRCLVDSDHPAADKVLRQTWNLAGQMSDEWQSRFEQLRSDYSLTPRGR